MGRVTDCVESAGDMGGGEHSIASSGALRWASGRGPRPWPSARAPEACPCQWGCLRNSANSCSEAWGHALQGAR